MRCNICDRPLDEPKMHPDIGEFEPCDVCMAVVESTLDSYTEKPAASEDDLGIDPLWDELFPPTYSPFDEED
jgi:hypothetical protein